MEYEIKINLEELAEYNLTAKQRCELVKNIMVNNMEIEEYHKTINYFLKDLLQSEQEFDKRKDVIDAYNTIIKTLS